MAFIATLIVFSTKCRSAANLEHNLCVKFAIKLSMSSELAISCEDLGGPEKISYWEDLTLEKKFLQEGLGA